MSVNSILSTPRSDNQVHVLQSSDGAIWLSYAESVNLCMPLEVQYDGETIEADGLITLGELFPEETKEVSGGLFISLSGLFHLASFSVKQTVQDFLNPQAWSDFNDFVADRHSLLYYAQMAYSLSNFPEGRKDGKQGFIYVIKQGDLYKIGYAKNANKRLSQIQTATPNSVSLVSTIETNHCKLAERQLHERYSKCRVHGEWFRLNQTHLKEIQSMGSMLYDTCNLPPHKVELNGNPITQNPLFDGDY